MLLFRSRTILMTRARSCFEKVHRLSLSSRHRVSRVNVIAAMQEYLMQLIAKQKEVNVSLITWFTLILR